MYTDPISDLLTRIRNGCRAGHRYVEIPASKLKQEICKVLLAEGFIKSYELKEVVGSPMKKLRVVLKYDANGFPVIRLLERASRPGKRRYSQAVNVPRRLNGAGVCILTTNKGVITDRQARRENVGGEILCFVE